jgi:hypothetical protein
MGSVFGILPCYLFPLFGGNSLTWCGNKSTPPYFEIQVGIGFFLMMGLGIYLFYIKKWRS